MRARIALVLALSLATTAIHAGDAWQFDATLRTRVEAWDWFQPRPAATGQENDYTYVGNLLRVSASHKGDDLDAFFELSAPLLLGLPDDAVGAAPAGQLGLGGTYRAANGGDEGSVFVKQAYVNYHPRKDMRVRAGRFEFSEGTEAMPGDPTLDWLRGNRISHRVLGNFGFTHVQRSLDGIHASGDTTGAHFAAIAAHPTVGVFDLDGNDELDDVGLRYASVTFKDTSKQSDGRLFVLDYTDDRALAKVDNRPAAARAADLRDVDVTTFGGHYLRKMGRWDATLWGALQMGEWASLNHRATAWAAEIGYQPGGDWKPWLRAGYNLGSGDANPADGRHKTFFQVLPTPRIYARFPFFNMMNLKDAFVQAIVKPHKRATVRADYHVLRLDEPADLWYLGGGAFQPQTFGFVGRPSGGSDDMGSLIDASLDYKIDDATSTTLYLSKAYGGQVMSNIYAGDDASLVYLEVTRKF